MHYIKLVSVCVKRSTLCLNIYRKHVLLTHTLDKNQGRWHRGGRGSHFLARTWATPYDHALIDASGPHSMDAYGCKLMHDGKRHLLMFLLHRHVTFEYSRMCMHNI